jgi:hypothetical protein
MCYRSPMSIICAAKDFSSTFCFQPDCKSWDCDVCRPKLMAAHLERIRTLFHDHSMIYVVCGAKEDWGAASTKMRRAEVNWLSIRPGDGTWIAYCDGDELTGGNWVSVPQGLTHAVQTLQHAQKPARCIRFRLVTCCRNWMKLKAVSKVVFLARATEMSFLREVESLGATAVEVIRQGLRSLRASLSWKMAVKLCDKFKLSNAWETGRRNGDMELLGYSESSACVVVPAGSG